MSIEVCNIYKSFGGSQVLRDVSLEVRPGELIALLGPSGSGKTTLLRIISGMEFPDSGSVMLNNAESSDKKANERSVGFVFQHYALFKHMTVFENVAFGLRVRPRRERLPEEQIQRKVMELLRLVHLDAFYNRYPSQLSGGQRQRVALARSLAVEPKILLLDEPFGALDAKVRQELRRWMRRLHDEINITSIFVTHDQEEAMEVADRVVVMSNGRIEQVGTPGEVYQAPVNSFVYDFLGNYNVFQGWKDDKGVVHLSEHEVPEPKKLIPSPRRWLDRYPEVTTLFRKILPPRFSTNAISQPAASKTSPAPETATFTLFARPHELYISRTADEHEYISAHIIHINPAGPLVKVELERPNKSLLVAEVPQSVIENLNLHKGDSVFVRPKNTRIFEDKQPSH